MILFGIGIIFNGISVITLSRRISKLEEGVEDSIKDLEEEIQNIGKDSNDNLQKSMDELKGVKRFY